MITIESSGAETSGQDAELVVHTENVPLADPPTETLVTPFSYRQHDTTRGQFTRSGHGRKPQKNSASPPKSQTSSPRFIQWLQSPQPLIETAETFELVEP